VDIDAFILANRPDWQRLEQACKHGRSGLARLDGRQIDDVIASYLKVSADLSQVQTRYQDPQLSAYLSSVLAAASSAIYSARPRTTRGALRLFGTRYRQAVHQTTPFIVVSAAVLVAVIVASYLWLIASPSAQSGLFPPEARAAMEMAGGEEGPDFDISPGAVSAVIFANNARVALLAFVLGITFGAGTLWMLVTNGFILGSLAAGFASVGRLGVFSALVAPHGILELTAICIAAGSGLRIGWSLIEPGDRSRAKALQEEAAQAVITAIGVIPAFLVAALIEGLVTGRALHVALQLAIGVAAEALYLVFIFGLPGRGRRLKTPPGLDAKVLVGEPSG
jgi:uncharacterized membrane protein SpoIIM required for sporulation